MPHTSIAGHLAIKPGAQRPIACDRPMIGAALMQRLTAGRPVASLPDVIGSVFTLCAGTQRATAQLAVRAAVQGIDLASTSDERTLLALSTARDHLQWLGLQLPLLAPREAAAADLRWLRSTPVTGDAPHADAASLRRASAALPRWLEDELLGTPCDDWLARWQDDPDGALTQWCLAQPHPVTRWLAAVRDDARAMALPCGALDVLDDPEVSMPVLAGALAREPAFATRPCWHDAPAETAAWTRARGATPVLTLWDRLGARIADLVQIARGAALSCGARALAGGEAIAWSEMSRGLLVHWIRLAPGPRELDSARAETYRVLAPTEWNFHPEGALSQALAHASARAARLAAAVFDPCIAFSIDEEAAHA